MEITKENTIQIGYQKQRNRKTIANWIKKHKLIAITFIAFVSFCFLNFILIYQFLEICYNYNI